MRWGEELYDSKGLVPISHGFGLSLYALRRVSKLKILELQSKLLEWYEINGRIFPWRQPYLSHYQIVTTETLLQRTKAETVARFYDTFFSEFPSWESLANADIESIEHALKPIGLYRQRSKRLQSLAREMVLRNGIFPENRSELESIPFLGQYIANSIELIIFNKPSPLIDVNMARVLERYFGKRKMADIRYDPYLQELSQQLSAHDRSKEVNWAVLDFGAIICKARRPLCQICPLQRLCLIKDAKNQ